MPCIEADIWMYMGQLGRRWAGATPTAPQFSRRLRRAGRSRPRTHRYLASMQHRCFVDLGRIVRGCIADSYYNRRTRPEGRHMSKLKIDHGISRVRRAKLQASIDQSVAEDIQMLADWSNNEAQYIINQLLRFALAQEEDFQKHKAGLAANPSRPATAATTAFTSAKPVADVSPKTDATTVA